MILFTIIAFIFILGLLVFVHELGHFIAAKRSGMKVEEFGFGFPPRMFGIKRGETTYTVNWIPLGGFVKILGEDETTLDDPRAFGARPFWPRLGVLLAGVAMNFILGWFLIFLGFSIIGTPVEIAEGETMPNAKLKSQELTIVAIESKSPAEYAGFKSGDVILSVDGQKFEKIDDMIGYNKSHGGTGITYELKRGQEVITREVTPRTQWAENSGPVGFAPAIIAVATYPIDDALRYSLDSFWLRAVGILSAFGQLLRQLFGHGKLVEGLAGPVGIAVLTRDFLNLGIVYIVQFAAVLSINLGVINAVPFPALDGGRVLFLVIEKIRGAKSLKFERVANTIGFLLLLLLMVVVTFGDITRFSDQFRRLFERIL